MSDDLRAVLESIVFGDDARITPGDRLRAAEQLRELQPPADRVVRLLASQMPQDETALDQALDPLIADDVLRAVESADGGSWPVLAALLTALVDRKAAELADEERIQKLVEERAEARARELVQSQPRLLPVPEVPERASETAPAGQGAPETGDDSPEPTSVVRKLPVIPAGIDPSAGWAAPRRSRRRPGR